MMKRKAHISGGGSPRNFTVLQRPRLKGASTGWLGGPLNLPKFSLEFESHLVDGSHANPRPAKPCVSQPHLQPTGQAATSLPKGR